MSKIIQLEIYPKRLPKYVNLPAAPQLEDQRIMPIAITVQTPEDDMATVYAALPFVPGTEKLYVNGILLCSEDSVIMLDADNNGYAIQTAGIIPGDDVHLFADIVEK